MQSAEMDGTSVMQTTHQREIYSIAFIADGKQVVSGGVEGCLRRWQVDDGREVGEAIQVEKGAEILVLALSPDCKRFVCGLRFPNGDNGRARVGVWDAQTREKLLDVRGHTNTLLSVDISPDSTRFATGGYDKMVYIWSLATGEKLLGPLQHEAVIVTVRFSPDGERIAVATYKNPGKESIRIYSCEDGRQQHDIPFSVQTCPLSPLAWSADGRQLFAVSFGEVKRFDTSSGDLLGKWSINTSGYPASIALARNQNFVVVSAYSSLSFWDANTYKRIGDVIKRTRVVWCIALSSSDDCVATGEENGTITCQSLRNILPSSYFTVNVSGYSQKRSELNLTDHALPTAFSSCGMQLPLVYLSDMAFKSWTEGNLARVEELLTDEIARPSNPFHRARALAHRAIIRIRLKRWNMATDDAKESVKVQPSTIGHIANAMTRVHDGEHEMALHHLFDLVFADGLPATESRYLLLIKAIVLFEHGKHDDAISRVDSLIDIVDDQSLYTIIRAQMLLLVGNLLTKNGDNERAVELFRRAQEAIPFQRGPRLLVISLIFGWDFDRLPLVIQFQLNKALYAMGDVEVKQSLSTIVETFGEEALTSEMTTDWDPDLVQKCVATFESDGDAAVQSENLKEAILRYSTALSLNPSNRAGILVKRSKVRATLGLWEPALTDADEAIKAEPMGPWGYERRHAALHGVQRYDEAIDAFKSMLSLIEKSLDQDVRQLSEKYVSPSRLQTIIENTTSGVFKLCPLVLIDVKSGRLCDGSQRMLIFKSEAEFKELVSSMTEELDHERIQQMVAKYFQYVMFSHVWGGNEPLFRDVNSADSVWNLDSSPLNQKLKEFCETVRDDGYRWAWSDTCCIDKTISTVLSQSLTMMYKWYEASASTFVHLASVASLSSLGDLTDSIWMTRAWTVQELLVPKVIRFYDSQWQPYLNDTRANHKESPEIMQELANAIGVARETITTFHPDDLSIREKLRLASSRKATIEEDVAYSLIGIFKSDIRPHYGEGDAALGHLLEEIVARSGDVTVLSWNGKSSMYNSCLPAILVVYSQPPRAPPPIEDGEMEHRVAALRGSLTQEEATSIYERIIRLPPARFANRRLHLPCVAFAIKRLGIQKFGDGQENHYRARVQGLGYVEFQTADRFSLSEPRKLIFVHPWIRDLRGPPDGFTWGGGVDGDESESELGSDSECSTSSSPLQAAPTNTTNVHTLALRLLVRLQQPFRAMLLQQQPTGEFRRVAAEHEILIPGLERHINYSKEIHVDVVEIL